MQREGAIDNPTILIGPTTSELIAPDTLFERVENLLRTEDGGYKSLRRPIPIIPSASGGNPATASPGVPATPTYDTCYGIHHARIREGQREVLLLHTGSEVWEFRGWARQWRRLIGESSAMLTMELPTPAPNDFPTQWVTTPTGVVIIPQGGRACFYDGVRILPLGYDKAPAPPIGMGPNSSSSEWIHSNAQPFFGVNDQGYVMDGLIGHAPSYMTPIFRRGRVGTIETPGNITTLATTPADKSQVMGFLLPGSRRARVQWVDCWGNLSPASGPSNEVAWQRQPAMKLTFGGATYTPTWIHAENALKQIAWEGILPGPDGTIGRILQLTKDLKNSGDPDYYEAPLDAAFTSGAFATLPDNMSRMFPDNIPDSWLNNIPTEVEAMPLFRLAEMAFGCLFVGNVAGDEGAVWRTYPGRWGTIRKGSKFYPDPAGAEITGMRRVRGGILFYTERSTFFLGSADGQMESVSSTRGCVAPSSIRTIESGMTVALDWKGFHGFDGQADNDLFDEHRLGADQFNRARLRRACAVVDGRTGEYRCWVPTAGSIQNDLCYVFDGAGWRTRTDVYAADATSTDDHRQLCLVAGKLAPTLGVGTTNDGAWVLDSFGAMSSQCPAVLESVWLTSTAGRDRRTVLKLYLWVRETADISTAALSGFRASIEIRKDYRAEVVETHYLHKLFPHLASGFGSSVNPSMWNTATWDGEDEKWRVRRPFWLTVDLGQIRSAEAFKFVLTCTYLPIEILGFAFSEQVRPVSGVMGQRSQKT